MPTFLASLGLKDAFYALVIAAVSGYAVWFVHHERMIGEDKIIASDNKAVALAAQRDTALTAASALAASINNGDYNREVAQPVTNAPAPDRLCYVALGSRAVRSPAGSDASGSAQADVPAANRLDPSALQQFADELSQVGRDADAQVEALEKDNALLRKQMETDHARK